MINTSLPVGLVLSVILLSSSCQKELKLPVSTEAGQPVIIAELIAGEAPRVQVGQSKPVQEGDIQFEVIKDASVRLIDQHTNTSETLNFNNVTSATQQSGTYSGNTRLKAGSSYKVEAVLANKKAAYAVTTLPQPFSADLADSATMQLLGREVLRVEFNINPAGNSLQYLVLEAVKQHCWLDTSFNYQGVWYRKKDNEALFQIVKSDPQTVIRKDTLCDNNIFTRVHCYTQDNSAGNNSFGNTFNEYQRIFYVSKQALPAVFYLNLQEMKATPGDDTHYGRIKLMVKSIPKAYYDYLLAYEQLNLRYSTGGGFLHESLQLNSNVSGGAGILGSGYQRLWLLYYDPL